MDARKNDSQDKNKKLSTAKITSFLHEYDENEHQVFDKPVSTNGKDNNDQGENKAFVLTKSYRPDPNKPYIFTEDEEKRIAEHAKHIRTDGHNLRFDENRQMYFYLPKNHPEYKEHPEPEYEKESNNYINRNCIII
jgi:hypothetical protein